MNTFIALIIYATVLLFLTFVSSLILTCLLYVLIVIPCRYIREKRNDYLMNKHFGKDWKLKCK